MQTVELIAAIGDTAEITISPLMGGLAPELGTASLELFCAEVLPALEQRGLWDNPQREEWNAGFGGAAG